MIEFNWTRLLNLLTLCFLVGVSVLFFNFVIKTGIDKQERVTCESLKEQSEEYELFFLTSNQKEMCDFHQIYINAEVK